MGPGKLGPGERRPAQWHDKVLSADEFGPDRGVALAQV